MDSSNRLICLRAVLTPGPVVLYCVEEQMAPVSTSPLACTHVCHHIWWFDSNKKKYQLFINEAINCYSLMAKSYPSVFQSAFTIMVKPKSTYFPKFIIIIIIFVICLNCRVALASGFAYVEVRYGALTLAKCPMLKGSNVVGYDTDCFPFDGNCQTPSISS